MDLKTALGAKRGATATKFRLYLPESDRVGAPVPRIEEWVSAAMGLFAEVNGGATRLPLAQGIWKPEGGGDTVREATHVVYSFVRDPARFDRRIGRLTAFIHSFGKHANQGEVMVEFSGEVPGHGFVSRAYFIDEYPKAGKSRSRREGAAPAGRPAPTPLTASLFEGGLAYTRRAVLGAAVAESLTSRSSHESDGLGMSGEGPGLPAPSSRGVQRRGAPELDCFAPLAMTEGRRHRRWSRALAAFRRADLAKERFGEASRAASAPAGGRAFEAQEALDEEYAGFVNVAEAAMLRLLETRAPDLEALVVKIALIADHLVWELDGGEDCLGIVRSDAERLALAHSGGIRYTTEA